MITCCHYQKSFQPDYRQEGKQRYCSAKACHQARKNNSESSRLQKDPAYKEKRRQQKREMV